MTYYTDLLQVLTTTPVDFDTIIRQLNLPQTKSIYVIQAIKKGLLCGEIIKYETIGEKREYKGHLYARL
jgi:hypothetical protein